MIITEITDKNSEWANLSNIDFDTIYNSFELLKETWPKILASKSPALIEVHKRNLTNFYALIEYIESKLINFPDTIESDLIRIKKDLIDIKIYIDSLLK